ncbi:MAG: glycosyl hydrolase family 8 [Saprospiraceae bacterium]
MDHANSSGKPLSQPSLDAKSRRIRWSGSGFACGLCLWLGTGLATAENWNLPYARPATYNFSSLYAPLLSAYLTSTKPDYFKAELVKAWTFYKANFISANGLVNHKRLENGAQIGANEAVSEGQGYGTLLAVLMNDQATFNKIFEAANANMWDAGHKSYYYWNIKSGSKSEGAATDADLDIGLALVFADELQKAKLWTAYSSGGVTYNSRAMEIIKSIKANMTSSDNYLLPGDKWASDGVNNLNPSYFCTAWLKVFNAYQKEVDFTAVIANCYAVLAKTPRYSFGQAPDWCNTSGGQSSQGGSKAEQGLGMLSDAIRTPYRIAMDALWFNDERAIAYCKNVKRTLTEYNNANSKVLAAQMALYSKSGVATVESQGSFDNVAMWTCGALGSKDTEFTQKVVSTNTVALIAGSASDFFGDVSLQDDKFYFKQSLAMLGFAAIGGQFPNIQADVKLPVSVVPGLTASKAKVSLHGIRTATPVWLTQEGVPSTSATSAYSPKTEGFYRNALGQLAPPLR